MLYEGKMEETCGNFNIQEVIKVKSYLKLNNPWHEKHVIAQQRTKSHKSNKKVRTIQGVMGGKVMPSMWKHGGFKTRHLFILHCTTYHKYKRLNLYRKYYKSTFQEDLVRGTLTRLVEKMMWERRQWLKIDSTRELALDAK
jgi:hypothetical protein